jgi:N-methylhydantoinase A/oxoprolinase/acetone carboxylase beta subunit
LQYGVQPVLLGVDVGGTFTDAVLVDGNRLVTAKAPTTPADQSLGVMDAIGQALRAAGRSAGEVTGFAHGMTVATNALLEGRGARTALVATEGFTDVVELGRQARADLYRLCAAHPAPLVPPERRFAAAERTGPDGVLRPLTEEVAAALAADVAASAAEAVAVVLLHGYSHPEHERRIGAVLRDRLGDVHVSLSHEVVGTFREFERAATTEVDAALSPLLGAYLRALLARAGEAELPEPAIMQSSGGLATARTAAGHAALTVLSGPAGGAAAAALIAERTGERDLVCFDMGGTSCDVCVVEDGVVRETSGRLVGGRPLALPMVDIHTVGAGGGSIAWRDPGGALRVGPRSAGAEPGPACYGRGGTEPTVTDANLVLARLDAGAPLAGGVRLDAAAAEQAIGALAGDLGLGVPECAAGIVRVANAEMVRALRVMTVERGVDPRRFALLAFGGAGPLHAAAIAEELGMTRIVVPRASGVLSALGLAAADRRRDDARTVLLHGDGLTADALREAAADAAEVAWDVRYRGQSFELTLRGVEPDPAAIAQAFAAAHEERYGYRDPDDDIEVVTVRRTQREAGPEIDWTAPPGATSEELAGPRVVALPEATLVIPEGWAGRADEAGTIVLERAR